VRTDAAVWKRADQFVRSSATWADMALLGVERQLAGV
jgi:hypothetical protein